MSLFSCTAEQRKWEHIHSGFALHVSASRTTVSRARNASGYETFKCGLQQEVVEEKTPSHGSYIDIFDIPN